VVSTKGARMSAVLVFGCVLTGLLRKLPATSQSLSVPTWFKLLVSNNHASSLPRHSVLGLLNLSCNSFEKPGGSEPRRHGPYHGQLELRRLWCVLTSSNHRSCHLLFLGLSTDIIQIESLEVSPDPPQPGKDLTVKVKAHVSQTIEVHHSLTRSCVAYPIDRKALSPMSP
jgi:hypothetical protein